VGNKLANPSTIKHFWEKGKYQFIPFIATFGAVVFTDLLKHFIQLFLGFLKYSDP
jgi:hypothetical protein